MSSLTSEIRRNTKLVIFTRDSVAALYQEKGSKHQDQLSQSDSAARKTQPLIHTGGAERATHVSSGVLWDKKNARNKLLKTRNRDRIFFLTTNTFPLLWLRPPFFHSSDRSCILEQRISHKEGCYVFPSSTCNPKEPRSGSRVYTPVWCKTFTSAERPGNYYARLSLVSEDLSSTDFASVVVPSH